MTAQLCKFTKITELHNNMSAIYGMWILPQ